MEKNDNKSKKLTVSPNKAPNKASNKAQKQRDWLYTSPRILEIIPEDKWLQIIVRYKEEQLDGKKPAVSKIFYHFKHKKAVYEKVLTIVGGCDNLHELLAKEGADQFDVIKVAFRQVLDRILVDFDKFPPKEKNNTLKLLAEIGNMGGEQPANQNNVVVNSFDIDSFLKNRM